MLDEPLVPVVIVLVVMG